MQRGKTSMTPIEELFIVKLMCSALPLTPKYAAIVQCVTVFFPRCYNFLEKNKSSDIFSTKARASVIDENQSVNASTEETVKNLLINLLRRKYIRMKYISSLRIIMILLGS